MSEQPKQTPDRARLWDVLAVSGLLLLTVGVGFIYWPLSFIVPGLALLTAGIVGAWKWAS